MSINEDHDCDENHDGMRITIVINIMIMKRLVIVMKIMFSAEMSCVEHALEEPSMFWADSRG